MDVYFVHSSSKRSLLLPNNLHFGFPRLMVTDVWRTKIFSKSM